MHGMKGVNCTVCNVVGWASAQIGCVPVTGFAFNLMRAGVNTSFSLDPTRATFAFIAPWKFSQALHFHAFDESDIIWSRRPPVIITLRGLVLAFHVPLIFILAKTLKTLSVRVDDHVGHMCSGANGSWLHKLFLAYCIALLKLSIRTF